MITFFGWYASSAQPDFPAQIVHRSPTGAVLCLIATKRASHADECALSSWEGGLADQIRYQASPWCFCTLFQWWLTMNCLESVRWCWQRTYSSWSPRRQGCKEVIKEDGHAFGNSREAGERPISAARGSLVICLRWTSTMYNGMEQQTSIVFGNGFPSDFLRSKINSRQNLIITWRNQTNESVQYNDFVLVRCWRWCQTDGSLSYLFEFLWWWMSWVRLSMISSDPEASETCGMW